MAQYKDGLINVVNGSDVVTGVGTLWLGNIAVNNLLTINGVAYTIDSNTTNTNLTLTGNYNGPTLSNQVYGISLDETAGGLPLLSAGDLNTAAIYNEAMKNIDNYNLADLGTAAYADKVGLVANGAIIETGTANGGTYTKWADGTMICTKSLAFNQVVDGVFQSAFLSPVSAIGLWPAQFVSTPIVALSSSRATNIPIDFQFGNVVGNNIQGPTGWFISLRIISVAEIMTVNVTATGRWF